MENIVKKMRLIKNNKGQAVLEYVLLTFVILVVLLGMIIGISRSTEKFAQNYFGEYFQCLLEIGELPTLGADGDSETECDDSFEPFTLADGWKSKDPEGWGDVESKNYGEQDPGDSSNDNNASGTADSTASSGASDSSATSYADSSSSKGFSGRSQKVPLSNADKKDSKSGSADLGNSSGLNNFQQNEEFGTDDSGRSSYVPIYGSRLDDEDKKKDAAVVKADPEKNPEQTLRGKRVPVSVPKSDEVKVKGDEGLSLPNFIKYLIIAAIILVIVIFFGGQVMQYQKSQD